MAFAVIRVRGHRKINKDIEDTMCMLRLTRVNHCVIIPENDAMKGMLQKAKDFITWGEVSEETLARMIRTRGRLMGDRPIDDDYVRGNSRFATVDELVKSVVTGRDQVRRAPGRQAPVQASSSGQGVRGREEGPHAPRVPGVPGR
jgi:large subunit ribosomal protein L30